MSGERYPRRSSQVPPLAAPERLGSGEVQELREQVAAMLGAIQRQETRLERLQSVMEQQVAAVAAIAAESKVKWRVEGPELSSIIYTGSKVIGSSG